MRYADLKAATDKIDVGQINYEAYAAGLGKEAKPAWNGLAEDVKEGWRAAARETMLRCWKAAQTMSSERQLLRKELKG